MSSNSDECCENGPATSTRLIQFVGWISHPAYSYCVIALLQLSVMWGLWLRRDTTSGDTSSYFVSAQEWWETGIVRNIHFSPLYTCFYGSIYGLTQDVVTATWLHRLIIVMTVSLLFLTLLRKFLPPLLAALIATWWVVLPINFNTMYEVHLFAAIPVLLAWLATTMRSARWGRGIGLGVLFLSAMLMRNEMLVATALFAAVSAYLEFRAGGWSSLVRVRTLVPYLVPVALVVATVVAFWSRVPKDFDFRGASRAKHTVNMGQVYAFGWQQRHPEWTESPWTGYSGLMTEHFGAAEVSLKEMIAANPGAVAEHFLWNLSLVPSGLQVLLFNAMYGEVNPDYAPVRSEHWWAGVLFVVVLSIIAAGSWVGWRQRRELLQQLDSRLAMTWAIMFCTVAVSLPVILTQRPRPSYLFPLSMFLMTLVGAGVYLLSGRRALNIRRQVVLWALFPLLIAVVPSKYRTPLSGPYTLSGTIEKLQPYADRISLRGTVFVKGEYAGEVTGYLGRAQCQSRGYDVLGDLSNPKEIEKSLEQAGANLLYVDERLIAEAETKYQRRRLLRYDSPDWELIACGSVPGDRWQLYRRQPIQTSSIAGTVARSVAETVTR
jgi:hypothetical protein